MFSQSLNVKLNIYLYITFRIYNNGVKHQEFFCVGNLFDHKSEYKEYFSATSLPATYQRLVQSGEYIKKPKRSIAVYCYGSTVMGSRFPLFMNEEGKRCMLPRPYQKCKPGSTGFTLMMESWFQQFVKDIETCVINFLKSLHPQKDKANKILQLIQDAKKHIPYECRISGSFFTHMSVIGRMGNTGEIPVHFDEKDCITALIHLGSVTKGGSTQYFNGSTVKDIGTLTKSIPFVHGQIQIGCFDKTLHRGQAWIGPRGCINFNMKQDVLKHFKDHGMKYFGTYRREKYPSGTFYA